MSSQKKEGKTPKYEAGFKIAVAREYLTGKLGYGKLAEKYELSSASAVREMVLWYKKTYPAIEAEAADVAVPPPVVRDAELEKALQHANLKIAGLEMLIEIAQKELGIDIVKKSGTKQSSK
jgi:transposase-like protein